MRSFELTDERTTSLALGWLVNNCETPRGVDIALQAIAGASSSIPKEPLLSGPAAEKIMQRLVSHSATDGEGSGNILYTRGLELLGFKSGLNSVDSEHGTTEDLEVMVWDLKSKNERQITDLMKVGSLIPSGSNLNAMRMGNSVISQGLRFLTKAESTIESLDSVAGQLSRNLESNEKQLNPAAVRALVNAAALCTSMSTTSKIPRNLAGLCMQYCEQVIREQDGNETAGTTHTLASGAIFVVCVLLHGRTTKFKSPPAETTQSGTQLRTRAFRAIRTLIDINREGASFQENIVWIGCLEILCNRSEYGLSDGVIDWDSLEHWCFERASKFVGTWGTPFIPSWSVDNKPVHSARQKLLMAISQVQEIVAISSSRGSEPTHLPEPIDTILTIVACSNSLDSWQSQVCYELLSKSSFPSLSEAFIDSLEMPTNKENETVLSAMGATFTENAQTPGRRQFAATQLWLLMHLVGDSSSDDQRRMRANIERELEGTLQLQRKGFDQAKIDLETFIVQGYRNDRTINDKVAKSRLSSIWDTFGSGLLAWWTGENSQHPPPHNDIQLDPSQMIRQAVIGDRRMPGKHQRVYTARIIELILRTRRLQGTEDLEALIEDDFRELPPCFQNLLPKFAPLPPSRATTQLSLVAQTEAVTASRPAVEPRTTETGHVSVEVNDSAGPSNVGGH
ncbi:hypothetical protein FRC11_014423 [Ceratobasidium sp. 423]|nr:hypothetical protein FRC11_014423 [Ceratobasidium sp. 423]